jgi:MoxR-like ATPase
MSSQKALEIKQSLKHRLGQNPITKGEGHGISDWEVLTELIITALLSKGHLLLTDHRSSGSIQLLRAIAQSTVSLECFDHVHCHEHMDAPAILGEDFQNEENQSIRMLFLENFPQAKSEIKAGILDLMRGKKLSPNGPTNENLLIVATEDRHGKRGIGRHDVLESFLFHADVPDLQREDERKLLLTIQDETDSDLDSPNISLAELELARTEIQKVVPFEDSLQNTILRLADNIAKNENTESYGGPSTLCLEQFNRALKAFCFWKSGEEDSIAPTVGKEHVCKLANYALKHRIIRTQNTIVAPATIIGRSLRNSNLRDPDETDETWTVESLSQMDNPWNEAWTIYERLKERVRAKVKGRSKDGKTIDGVSALGTIDLVLTALFANGHVLLEDFPGTGKSYLAEVIGNSIEDDKVEEDFDIPSYKRIQCTPDLLPQDITGYTMLQDGKDMIFRHGPVFAYILLIDEINRTTPKVQSGFLEAMAEKQVTIEGKSHALGSLFFCIATQNPLDKIGTFELPAAQLDRFLFKRRLEAINPEATTEVMLLDLRKDKREPGKKGANHEWNKVNLTEVVAVRDFILQNVTLLGVEDEHLRNGAMPGEGSLPSFLNLMADKFREKENLPQEHDDKLRPGSAPSPRTLQKLIRAMQVQAFVESEGKRDQVEVTPEHFKAIATDLLRHRIFPENIEDEDAYVREKKLDALIIRIVKQGIDEFEALSQQ